jgi:DNA-binding response OmpR family regulator
MKNGPVLLVDDEPVVLKINAAAVRHFGFDAITADTVEDGLEIVRAYKPALIISDVQMPGMGGFDFAESMERQGMKLMPIIYMTGYNDLEVFRGGLRVGGDDFVAKGSPIEVLRRRVAFWMTTGFPALPKDLRRRALHTNGLKTPWAPDMWPLLKQFENYVADPRFVYAGNDGLRHFRDYAWISEGHELFE